VQAGGQEYGPWGQVRAVSGSLTSEPLNYTGQRLDGTGLLYYHARYYDPALARFVSADSVVPNASGLSIGPDTPSPGPANPQNLNRYAYVTNNPLNHADPTGHCGTSGFRATAVSVMSGDCTRRAYDALTKAKTTEGKVVSGAVMVASAVGAAAGWVGGAILAAAGVGAAVSAVAGGGTAAVAAESAGAVAAAASVDGDPTNEVNAAATVAQSAMSGGGDVATRALTQADLGVKGVLQQLNGTLSVSNGQALVRIDMIRGDIKNPFQMVENLSATARNLGATSLRIEALLANEKLYDILVRRYGLITEGGKDVINIPIK
jgi:RHS repeat-associated protein